MNSTPSKGLPGVLSSGHLSITVNTVIGICTFECRHLSNAVMCCCNISMSIEKAQPILKLLLADEWGKCPICSLKKR